MCRYILSAMGNLCIIENNKQRLGAVGACEAVVRAARLHLEDRSCATAAALCMNRLSEQLALLVRTSSLATSYSSYSAAVAGTGGLGQLGNSGTFILISRLIQF